MQKMMTKKLAKSLPALYSTDGQGKTAKARGHWFSRACDWYATEYDAATGECFGLVAFHGYAPELGYFSINEFERWNEHPFNERGQFDPVERDLYFTPATIESLCK